MHEPYGDLLRLVATEFLRGRRRRKEGKTNLNFKLERLEEVRISSLETFKKRFNQNREDAN